MNSNFPTGHLTPSRRPLAGLLAAALTLAPLAVWPVGEGSQKSQPGGELTLERINAKGLARLLEKHRGKVVLVNFWATWCGPCVHEIPALLRLKNKLAPSAFVLLPISVDKPADSDRLVQAFIQEKFPKWYSYLSSEPEDYLIVDELDPHWPGAIPANYLIGPDGNLARTLLGGHTEVQFEEAVHQLITAPETAP